MRRSYFFASISFFLLFAGGLCAQEKDLDNITYEYTLKGQLLDTETLEVIPFAHITNQELQLSVSSNGEGFFALPVSEGDSLKISSVTYGQVTIIAPKAPAAGKNFVISLSPNVYKLDEVVVKSFPSEYLLKQQILGMEMPEKNKPNLGIPENYSPKAAPSENASIGLGSPVSAIAGRFSKKQRGREFAAEMKAKETRKAVISKKFNREIVKEITHLKDEGQLDAFMQYCVLSEDFIYGASEYEIHKAVLGCFKEFSEG